MKPYLSVVIPCYNEKENLERGVLDEVDDFMKKQNFSWEVVIADDGSTDGSWNLVEEFVKGKENFAHIKIIHAGKPFAVRAGIEKAQGDWVLLADMDLATPIDQLTKLLPFFKENDVVIGSRGMSRKNFPLYRQLGSIVFLNIRRFLLWFLPKVKDTQCGFKAFKREVALKVFPMLQVFRVKAEAVGWKTGAYDVELLFITDKLGYRIAEVTVKWEDTDISQGKKRSYSKQSMEMLKEILRVKKNDLEGQYGR